MRTHSKHSKLMLAIALAACARTGVAVAGVVVEGNVKIDGPIPSLPPLKLTKDTTACGTDQAANEVVVAGSDGALRNVVVSLHAMKPSSPSPGHATLDQVGCLYRPHVQAVTVGSELTLVNSDRVLHNVHASLGPVTVFNVAMPIKGQRLPTKLTRPGPVRIQCDAGHPWMSAWVYVSADPLFAVTDEHGHFSIADVPPGEYTVAYWHEPLDGKGAGITKSAPLNVGGKPVRADARLKL